MNQSTCYQDKTEATKYIIVANFTDDCSETLPTVLHRIVMQIVRITPLEFEEKVLNPPPNRSDSGISHQQKSSNQPADVTLGHRPGPERLESICYPRPSPDHSVHFVGGLPMLPVCGYHSRTYRPSFSRSSLTVESF